MFTQLGISLYSQQNSGSSSDAMVLEAQFSLLAWCLT